MIDCRHTPLICSNHVAPCRLPSLILTLTLTLNLTITTLIVTLLPGFMILTVNSSATSNSDDSHTYVRPSCLALHSPQEIAEAAAEAPLSAAAKPGVDASSRGSALLFVHGAAIKFEQAVRRTSQMKV